MRYREEFNVLLQKELPVSPERKIFCLSLPKGGTTSFQRYLEAAGMSVAGSGVTKHMASNPTDFASWAQRVVSILQLDTYRGFQDQPWCFFGEACRAGFPNGKFVIFTRPFDEWWKSFRFHFADYEGPKLFAKFFGVSPSGLDEREYRAAYDAHYAQAAAVAEGASITIALAEPDEDKRAKLNAFLGLDVDRYGHQLAHQRRLINQVRKRMKSDPTDARALLERYRTLYGEDVWTAKAARMIERGVE